MRLDVARDLSKSARCFVDVVWPQVGPWLGGGELIPVEGLDDAALLDMFAGIDGWHVQGNERRIRGLASRVQSAPHLYSSFTIRSRRVSGAETELAKRLAALYEPDKGWLFPAITVQGYAAADEFVAAGCIYTRDLYTYIADGQEGRDYEVKRNGQDGNEFYVVWWEDLRSDGVRLRTVGDERLADRSFTSRASRWAA